MTIFYIVALLLLLTNVQCKGMWGARRRKSDEEPFSPQVLADRIDKLADVEIDNSGMSSFPDMNIDMETVRTYITQAEEALTMMEQFIRSPECTPEYISAVVKEMAPELYDQPELQSILLQLPDKRKLRKQLKEGVAFSRKVLKDLPEIIEEITASGALDTPDLMAKHIASMVTPEMADTLRSILDALEPHQDALQSQLGSVLDAETLDMLRPWVDTVFNSLQDKGSGGDETARVSIRESLVTLLGSLTSTGQVH